MKIENGKRHENEIEADVATGRASAASVCLLIYFYHRFNGVASERAAGAAADPEVPAEAAAAAAPRSLHCHFHGCTLFLIMDHCGEFEYFDIWPNKLQQKQRK